MSNFIEATFSGRAKKTWINTDLVTEFFESPSGGTRFLFQISASDGDIIYSDVKESPDMILDQLTFSLTNLLGYVK